MKQSRAKTEAQIRKVCEEALGIYDKAPAKAKKVYNEACDKAWKVYDEAWKVYDEALIEARKVYDEAKKVYDILKERHGDKKMPYSKIADEILSLNTCSEAIICPLRAPNAFERIYNLNKILKSRGFGEIQFASPGIVQLI